MHGGYKTALCKNFIQHGNCSFGKQCNYAHGPMELRSSPAAGMIPPMPRSMLRPPMYQNHSRRKEPEIYHPKYRTSLCASVINGTDCTNGMLCSFFDFHRHTVKSPLQAAPSNIFGANFFAAYNQVRLEFEGGHYYFYYKYKVSSISRKIAIFLHKMA